MFDGLREKLGKFTEDVEEDVDADAVEKDVDADATEEAATGEHIDETDASEAAGGPERTARDVGEPGAVEGTADGTGEPDSSDGERARSGPETSDDRPGVEHESDDEQPVDADTSTEGDEATQSDRGIAERAKLFATGKSVIDEADLQSHLDDLEMVLLSSDVEMGVTQEVLEGVEANLVGETRRRLSSTGNLVRDALREALYEVISVGQFDFEERIETSEPPVVVVFTGVNGVGKTTTIAKLSRYLAERGYSSVLANGDTYRAGANEQLQQHADTLDRPVISHEQGSDPAAVIYDAVEYADANGVDVVLGDTAGRLHTSDDLMEQLAKIDRVVEPDMTLFVDEAVAGQDAVNRAREFDRAAEVDGTILTKADADPRGGAAISIAHVTGKPILFLGTGQGYDHLERFDPAEVVDRLIGN